MKKTQHCAEMKIFNPKFNLSYNHLPVTLFWPVTMDLPSTPNSSLTGHSSLSCRGRSHLGAKTMFCPEGCPQHSRRRDCGGRERESTFQPRLTQISVMTTRAADKDNHDWVESLCPVQTVRQSK